MVRKKPKTRMGGPFLVASVLCESIMEDASKKLSAINILDGTKVFIDPHAPPDTPSKDNPIPLTHMLLLMFKTGDAPGKHQLKLVLNNPGGQKISVLEKHIELPRASNGGINIKTHIQFAFASPGLYWIDVSLDGKRMTSIPFDLSTERLSAEIASPSEKTTKTKKISN